MSADNSIVIVHLKGKFHVDHLGGDIDKESLRNHVDFSKPLDTENEAVKKAERLKLEAGYVEHGICGIFYLD